jgi:hypothetical protein
MRELSEIYLKKVKQGKREKGDEEKGDRQKKKTVASL